jgi:N-acyl-D-aspartate/D-glutamate deacylase
VREAVAAGARGISTSYLDVDEDLRPVASRFADPSERIALARAAREAGGSVLETVPQAGDPAELEACIRELGRISRESGILCTLQPIIYLPIQPELWRSSLEWIEQEVERGARLYGQSPPGPMSFNLRLDETFFTFFLLPGWGEIMRRPVAERAALFADPSRRQALRAEGEGALSLFLPNTWIGETYSSANQGITGRKLSEVAEERGLSLVDALIEISLADGLHTEFPIRGAMHGPEEIVQEILAHPNVLVGASDAGAHLSQFCGAGDASYFLAEYVRRRKVYSLEEAIHRLTGQPAALFELHGRGRLEVGAAADLVLFDPERIEPGPEVFVRDLPGNATRYLRDAAGVSRVWVGGQAIVEDGQYTKARPGRIV